MATAAELVIAYRDAIAARLAGTTAKMYGIGGRSLERDTLADLQAGLTQAMELQAQEEQAASSTLGPLKFYGARYGRPR